MSTSEQAKPTERQLRYLRSLAARTGTTFAYPATRAQASGEIARLRTIGRAPLIPDRGREPSYATEVRRHEVDGYGASATWRVNPPPVRRRRRQRSDGGGQEVARYTVAGGERVVALCETSAGKRIDDRPASGRGRVYVVERELSDEDPQALRALVDDYVGQAARLDAVPMAGVALRRILATGHAGV